MTKNNDLQAINNLYINYLGERGRLTSSKFLSMSVLRVSKSNSILHTVFKNKSYLSTVVLHVPGFRVDKNEVGTPFETIFFDEEGTVLEAKRYTTKRCAKRGHHKLRNKIGKSLRDYGINVHKK